MGQRVAGWRFMELLPLPGAPIKRHGSPLTCQVKKRQLSSKGSIIIVKMECGQSLAFGSLHDKEGNFVFDSDAAAKAHADVVTCMDCQFDLVEPVEDPRFWEMEGK